jgi:fatty-acid desaturase
MQFAPRGRHWWEIDVTCLTILLRERLGLMWDVTRRRNAAVP